MDIFDKKDLRADQMFKNEVKDGTDLAGKYVSAMRKNVNKRWEKKLAWWCWLEIFLQKIF